MKCKRVHLLFLICLLPGCASSLVRSVVSHCNFQIIGVKIEYPFTQTERFAESVLNVFQKGTINLYDTLDLSAILKVQNDNGFKVFLTSLEYSFLWDDMEIGHGNYPNTEKPLSVDAHSADQFELPMKMSVTSTTVKLFEKLIALQGEFDLKIKAMLSGEFGTIPLNMKLKKNNLVLDQPERTDASSHNLNRRD